MALSLSLIPRVCRVMYMYGFSTIPTLLRSFPLCLHYTNKDVPISSRQLSSITSTLSRSE